MSAIAVSVATQSDQVQPTVQTQPKVFTLFPQTYYFETSEFYKIRGGFVAEVIQNPSVKFLEKGILNQVTQDLTMVTLAAFGKRMEEKEMYAPEKVIHKNGIFVDWLTVIRAGSEIIAYTSASYLGKEILYLNAAMVNMNFQSASGLGIIPHLYLWTKLLDHRHDQESLTLNIVMRSRNKDVANIMSHVLKNEKISGETNLTFEEKMLFSHVAKQIGSSYDENTGINFDVYPNGLPGGSDKHGEKLNMIFSKLGECDAYLISGKANYLRMKKLLQREISDMPEHNFLEYYEKAESIAA
jgi:hypothetical protein